MNLETARLLRNRLGDSDWVARTRSFATTLRRAGHDAGGLLIIGTPDDEPWHFAAHLDDAARLAGFPQLAPTLIRHRVPDGARPHLAVGLTRLSAVMRGETVLVIAPTHAPEVMLYRLQDARRAGATILAIETGDPDLQDLAHDALTITDGPNVEPAIFQPARPMLGASTTTPSLASTFDAAQHLVSLATTEPHDTAGRRRDRRRDRLLGAAASTSS